MGSHKHIITYHYVYGAGCAPNRKLCFYRNKENKLRVKAKGRRNGGDWMTVSILRDKKMTIEALSTNEKMERMMEAREKGVPPNYEKDFAMDKLNIDEQNDVLKKLQPKGKYSITILTDLGGNNPYFETVKGLIFFRLD